MRTTTAYIFTFKLLAVIWETSLLFCFRLCSSLCSICWEDLCIILSCYFLHRTIVGRRRILQKFGPSGKFPGHLSIGRTRLQRRNEEMVILYNLSTLSFSGGLVLIFREVTKMLLSEEKCSGNITPCSGKHDRVWDGHGMACTSRTISSVVENLAWGNCRMQLISY